MILREFLKLYNFRYINHNQKENTQIVRIHINFPDTWFEFGIKDWYWNDDRDEAVEFILTKKLLDSDVTSVSYDEDNEVFCIYTEEQSK